MNTVKRQTTVGDILSDLSDEITSGSANEEWLTPRQVSKELQVDKQTVYRWVRSGELRAFDLSAGRKGKTYYRIRRSDLDLMLELRVRSV